MCSSLSPLSTLLQAQQSQVNTQIGIAVVSKSNEITQDQGQAAIELLQSATEINKQLGAGLHFDVRA